MNKTAKIIIAIMSAVIVFLVVFSNIQANEAKKQEAIVIKLTKEAQLSAQRADAEAKRAEDLAAKAIDAQIEAQRSEQKALVAIELAEKCRKSK